MKGFKVKGVRAVWAGFFILLLMFSPADASGIGKQAPDFLLPSLKQTKVSLSDYRGKTILLNFWASWCVPCREELPELERLHQQFHAKGFEVLGINIDKKRTNAEKYVQRFALNFTVLLDPDAEIIQDYPGRAMPISYLIDAKGVIQEIFFGFNRKKMPEMAEAIQKRIEADKRNP